jgi:hypothetical protein
LCALLLVDQGWYDPWRGRWVAHAWSVLGWGLGLVVAVLAGAAGQLGQYQHMIYGPRPGPAAAVVSGIGG